MPQALFLKPFISAPLDNWSKLKECTNSIGGNVKMRGRLEVVCMGMLAPRKFLQKRKKVEVFKDAADEADQKNWRRLMNEIEEKGSAVTVLKSEKLKNKMIPKDVVLGTLVRFKQLRKWNLVGEILEWLQTQDWWDFSEMDFLMLITAYGKQGKFNRAEKVLSLLNEKSYAPSVISHTALMEAYGKGGRYNNAEAIFRRMQSSGPEPSAVTYQIILKIFVEGCKFQEAEEIFETLLDDEKSPLKPDQKMFHMMIYMFKKAGSYEKARKMFAVMTERGIRQSTVTYNSLMSFENNYKEVSKMYNQMQRAGLRPDVVSYALLISAYGKARREEEALAVFEEMLDAGVRPTRKAYNILLDAFAVSGMVDQARTVFKSMRRDRYEPATMSSSKSRRKVTPAAAADNGDSAEKLDQLLLSSAISNGEDVGPFVRKAFASGKPETLLLHLRHFSRSKESEIEEVCRAHYQDFIQAVDDLRSLLSDVDSLKSSLSESNAKLQAVGLPLLTSLDSFVEARNVCRNVNLALQSVRSCVRLMELCSRSNYHLSRGNFYMALKCLDTIECVFLDKTPSSTIKRMMEKKIPEIRWYIERKVMKDFNDWLVEIRVMCRNLGQLAIGQASSARQREEDLRIKQRQAEEQSRLSLRDCVYALEEEDEDPVGDDSSNGEDVDLTPLYRAYHIHQTLGVEDRFKQYYFENRKLQLTSDFQVSSMTPFLESHQTFFAQIAGFFIVEDRVVRTGGGLISKLEVENLWETAVSKMCSVLEDQFSRMQTANHLLLIKDYVSLLGVTLRRYGYLVDPLLDVLSKHRDKYHELLLSDCRKQITEALSADKFDQMLMKKEYEYSMNVLSFQIQTSDITPAFPYVAPFSSTVPDCCRIVRSFIEDSVSFMSYGGQLDFFEVVKKYLDRLLSEDLDGALVKLINTSISAVSHAMQVAANMAVMERACDFFFRHAAQLSGIPLRMVERGRRQFPLCKARDAAEDILSGLLKQKVDGFMMLMEHVNWMADETLQNGNEYVNEVIIYLETLVSTAQQILPPKVLKRVIQDVLSHISEKIVGALLGDTVKRFTVNAIMSIDVDIRILESFADNQAPLLSEEDANQLKSALAESRQLVNLLLSNNPETFLNPVIRERSYNNLDYRKVVIISEKLRDSSERLFGTFGSRGSRQNPKKKSLDSLIKRLKDMA